MMITDGIWRNDTYGFEIWWFNHHEWTLRKEKLLGWTLAGEFGIVRRAFHRKTGRQVAATGRQRAATYGTSVENSRCAASGLVPKWIFEKDRKYCQKRNLSVKLSFLYKENWVCTRCFPVFRVTHIVLWFAFTSGQTLAKDNEEQRRGCQFISARWSWCFDKRAGWQTVDGEDLTPLLWKLWIAAYSSTPFALKDLDTKNCIWIGKDHP